MPSREKPEESHRAAIAAAVGVTVAAAALATALWLSRSSRSADGHAAPDLPRDGSRPDADARAPAHFRPDPTAPVSAADREALRPATGPSPSLVQDRGGVRSEP